MTQLVVRSNDKEFKYNLKDVSIITAIKAVCMYYHHDTAGNYISTEDTLIVIYLMGGAQVCFKAPESCIIFKEE